MAGIIAGNGFSVHGLELHDHCYEGIAPQANLLDFQVLDQNGEGSDSLVILAIERAIEVKNQYNVGVINLSLGRPVYTSFAQDPLCQAVEAAWKAGIVVVVAAGNDGRDTSFGLNGYGTITSPGNDPFALTVGAMKDMYTSARVDDQITTYSSRGPSMIDHVVKPDLVAPGNLIVSLYQQGGSLGQKYPNNVVSPFLYEENATVHAQSSYYDLSGTSMSAAVVSGAVADLLSGPGGNHLTPDQVKARLMATASKQFRTYTPAYYSLAAQVQPLIIQTGQAQAAIAPAQQTVANDANQLTSQQNNVAQDQQHVAQDQTKYNGDAGAVAADNNAVTAVTANLTAPTAAYNAAVAAQATADAALAAAQVAQQTADQAAGQTPPALQSALQTAQQNQQTSQQADDQAQNNTQNAQHNLQNAQQAVQQDTQQLQKDQQSLAKDTAGTQQYSKDSARVTADQTALNQDSANVAATTTAYNAAVSAQASADAAYAECAGGSGVTAAQAAIQQAQQASQAADQSAKAKTQAAQQADQTAQQNTQNAQHTLQPFQQASQQAQNQLRSTINNSSRTISSN